jgi:hypothetical protein
MALLALLTDVIGPLSIASFLAGGPSMRRHLANAPRKRRPAVAYPVRRLF